MSVAIVAHGKGLGSVTLNTSGANLLVVLVVSYQQDAAGSVTDSVGGNDNGTYTALTAKAQSFDNRSQIHYVKPTNVGASHVITHSGGAYVEAFAFSGIDQTTPYESENGAASGLTSIQPGSVTPSANGALVFTGLGLSNTNLPTPSIDAGFDNPPTEYKAGQAGGGGNFGAAASYLVQGTAAAVNPTWTFSSSFPTAVIAVFRASTVVDTTAPTITGASIPSGGGTIVLTASEAITAGAGGTGGLTLAASGGAVTATYSSGTGTTTVTYALSRTVYSGETVTRSYAQPGDGWEDAAGNDLATFSAQPVTNNSTQVLAPSAPTGLAITAVTTTSAGIGFADDGGAGETFTLQIDPDDTFPSPRAYGIGASDTTLDFGAALAAGTTYYARIRATNAGGSSPWSTTATFRTPATATGGAIRLGRPGYPPRLRSGRL